MPDIRHVPSGSTPEQVLAAEVARLSREVADLRSTSLARTFTEAQAGALFRPAAFRGFRGGLAAPFTLTTSTWQAIPISAETFDTDVLHNGSDTGVFVQAGGAGYHSVYGGLTFAANATGPRYVAFAKNGVRQDIYGFPPVSAFPHGVLLPPDTFYLAAGDYIELHAHQQSGGDLDVTTARLVLLHEGT